MRAQDNPDFMGARAALNDMGKKDRQHLLDQFKRIIAILKEHYPNATFETTKEGLATLLWPGASIYQVFEMILKETIRFFGMVFRCDDGIVFVGGGHQ